MSVSDGGGLAPEVFHLCQSVLAPQGPTAAISSPPIANSQLAAFPVRAWAHIGKAQPSNLTVSTGNYDHNLWCSIRFLAPPSGRDPAE